MTKTDSKNRNVLIVAGIIVSLLGVLTLILSWIHGETSLLGFTSSTDYTAIQLASEFRSDDYQKYIPLLIGMLSLWSLFSYIGARKGGKMIAVIAYGVITVIISILFYSWVDPTNIGYLIGSSSIGVGIGFYIGIIAAVLNIIIGVLISKSS
ncbi:MAG: hypothetical protein LBM39_01695 [Candidatus Methanoplasma sp.]|jgi:hypothetical protein|nr:hypothetical protein [Candidatus Methanoplasma sp.]